MLTVRKYSVLEDFAAEAAGVVMCYYSVMVLEGGRAVVHFVAEAPAASGGFAVYVESRELNKSSLQYWERELGLDGSEDFMDRVYAVVAGLFSMFRRKIEERGLETVHGRYMVGYRPLQFFS